MHGATRADSRASKVLDRTLCEAGESSFYAANFSLSYPKLCSERAELPKGPISL